MAIPQFLTALQVARGVLFGRYHEPTNGPGTTRSRALRSAKQTADIWFVPNLVEDYDEPYFRFLPPDEQKQLEQAIDDFRQLTTSAQGNLPSDTQIRKGYDLVAKILSLTAPLVGNEADLRKMSEAIQSVKTPDSVLWVEYEFFTDSTNDPAIWVWLVLKDDVKIESRAVQDELAPVRTAIREAIQRTGINRWPYDRVRTRSETKARLLGAA